MELETKPIRVPNEVHSLLNEARKTDIMRPTLGQVVTKLAYEHYGHLAKTPSQEAAARPVAPQNPQNGATGANMQRSKRPEWHEVTAYIWNPEPDSPIIPEVAALEWFEWNVKSNWKDKKGKPIGYWRPALNKWYLKFWLPRQEAAGQEVTP